MCEICEAVIANGSHDLGTDGEDGFGSWMFERLSDGTIVLSYQERDEVLGSIEITHCPFCGAKLPLA